MKNLKVVVCCFLLSVFTCFSVVPTVSGAKSERRIALVIGNTAYSNGPLVNAVNDARLISEKLEQVGFDVDLRLNTDQKTFKSAIRDFGERLEEGGAASVGLFFYAGHGVQFDGRNYLIPVDAEINRASDVAIESVGADLVLNSMHSADSRLNIVILDACRNNPFTRGFRSHVQGLARMEAPSGTLLAYSTAPGTRALDGEGEHSPYSAALASLISKPGLTVERLFKLVRVSVMANTNDEQVPWESSSLTGDFFFNLGKDESTSSVQSTLLDLEMWDAIRDAVDASEFEAYLAKFPNGMFASAAEKRIDYLTEEKTAWAKALSDDRKAGFETFLKQFPNGAFAELARAKLVALYSGKITEGATTEQFMLGYAALQRDFNPSGKWRVELSLNEGSCDFNLDENVFVKEMKDGKLALTSYFTGGYLSIEIRKKSYQSVASALFTGSLATAHAETEIILHEKTTFNLTSIDTGRTSRGGCGGFSVNVVMSKI